MSSPSCFIHYRLHVRPPQRSGSTETPDSQPSHFTKTKPVADPGFPRGGGANSQGGAPSYDFVNFRRKLHENEEILAATGAHVPCAPP